MALTARFFCMIESFIQWLLSVLAVPEIGLTSVFLISLISATLLPLGSEPAVFAVVKANPDLLDRKSTRLNSSHT